SILRSTNFGFSSAQYNSSLYYFQRFLTSSSSVNKNTTCIFDGHTLSCSRFCCSCNFLHFGIHQIRPSPSVHLFQFFTLAHPPTLPGLVCLSPQFIVHSPIAFSTLNCIQILEFSSFVHFHDHCLRYPRFLRSC